MSSMRCPCWVFWEELCEGYLQGHQGFISTSERRRMRRRPAWPRRCRSFSDPMSDPGEQAGAGQARAGSGGCRTWRGGARARSGAAGRRAGGSGCCNTRNMVTLWVCMAMSRTKCVQRSVVSVLIGKRRRRNRRKGDKLVIVSRGY